MSSDGGPLYVTRQRPYLIGSEEPHINALPLRIGDDNQSCQVIEAEHHRLVILVGLLQDDGRWIIQMLGHRDTVHIKRGLAHPVRPAVKVGG